MFNLRFLCCLLMLWGLSAFSQLKLQEFVVKFGPESSVLDVNYEDNADQLESLVSLLKDDKGGFNNSVLSVKFVGATSAEGSRELNDRLTVERRQAVQDYLSTRCAVPVSIVSTEDVNIDWSTLRKQVDNSDYIYKDSIIDIIDEGQQIVPFYDDLTIDYRVLKLHKVGNGRAWRHILHNYFPAMRYAKAVVLVNEPVQEVEQPLLQVLEETVTEQVEPVQETEPASEVEEECYEQRMALKTNLLYDAILMPSAQLEYCINDHWFINFEGDVAWYRHNPAHKYYEIATLVPEVRYRFGNKPQWKGHYVGAFTGFTWYDLENGARGYKGEGGFVGLSYNYSFPISKYLSFEAGLGVGFLYCRNREYLPIDNHYVYQKTTNLYYFGPLRAQFSLVWRFWNQKCKGGKR